MENISRWPNSLDKVTWLKRHWILLLGIWIAIDGVGSILVFYPQPLIDHIPRFVRFWCGLALVVYDLRYK